jgi:ribosome recycling factor
LKALRKTEVNGKDAIRSVRDGFKKLIDKDKKAKTVSTDDIHRREKEVLYNRIHSAATKTS